MKILALNGSPTRKRGMTHILLELLLEGAEAQGAEVEYLMLHGHKISPCLGCYRCWVKTPGKCIQKDDMQGLLEKMMGADCLVLGTPVYLDGMTAQMKTFIDRTIPLFDPHFELAAGHVRHMRRHARMPKVALAAVAGFYEMDNFDPLVAHVEAICRNWQTEFLGALLRPVSYFLSFDQHFPEQVSRVKKAVARAGSELAENGAFSPATLAEAAENHFPKEFLVKSTNAYWDRCVEAGKWPL